MKWLALLSQIFLGPKLASRRELRGFLEGRAAYLAQKSIAEYTQARANMMFSTLLGEKIFQDAYERARWFSFPAALSMVAEALAARLRNLDISDTDSINVLLQSMAREIVSAYPVPAGGSADFWQMALLDLERDLLRAGMAAPHSIHLIPKARSREIFENLPVHPSVRKHDFDMFQNTLSFHLTEIGAEIEDAFNANTARRILQG
ncbi:MAG: hypothetical protein Q7T14_02570 [Aestuariivirga sp.]|nr:hypothetical protein [Aestuariivirga sp.]